MNVRIDESWRSVLQPEFDKPYFELLTSFVRNEYQTKQCFPPSRLIFNAFDSCPFDRVRVVIIGQSDKTLIMMSAKRTDSVSLSTTEWRFRHRSSISTKR